LAVFVNANAMVAVRTFKVLLNLLFETANTIVNIVGTMFVAIVNFIGI
jgi:hypothetical protein